MAQSYQRLNIFIVVIVIVIFVGIYLVNNMMTEEISSSSKNSQPKPASPAVSIEKKDAALPPMEENSVPAQFSAPQTQTNASPPQEKQEIIYELPLEDKILVQ